MGQALGSGSGQKSGRIMDEITIPNDASPETLKAVSLHCATMIGVQHGWDHERVLAIAHLFHEFVDPCGVERKPS